DLVVRPTTSEAAAGAAYPPTDIHIAITSANVNGAGGVRINNGVLTTLGEGLTIDVASAGPAVARLMAPPPSAAAPGATPAPTSSVEVSGRLPVRLSVRDVSVDTNKKPFALGDVTARAEV